MSELDLRSIAGCMAGAIPAVLATSSAGGIPNVTYLSKVQLVDGQRVALSNQFLSKSTRNLVENPHACLLVVDPETHDEYRLDLTYERTERSGPVFDRLAADVAAIAAVSGMTDVFQLLGADIFRCVRVEGVRVGGSRARDEEGAPRPVAAAGPGLAELCARLTRSQDLDTLVRVAVSGIADLLGHHHAMLLLADEHGSRLFTIASHGYDAEGVGSEVPVGEGIVGAVAARCEPIRVGNLRQMTKYGRSVRRSYEAVGGIGPGHEVPVPGLAAAQSRLAVPAMVLGRLVGVVTVESERPARYGDDDAASLLVVAALLAASIEAIRAEERAEDAGRVTGAGRGPAAVAALGPAALVRFFAVDGSTFLDGDYLIKGVAGRLLWSLLRQHAEEGRVDFTNREVRLDPTLELPDFRDNFESRLILLKRRLDERNAPIRIVSTGRGRFRLDVAAALRLELMS